MGISLVVIETGPDLETCLENSKQTDTTVTPRMMRVSRMVLRISAPEVEIGLYKNNKDADPNKMVNHIPEKEAARSSRAQIYENKDMKDVCTAPCWESYKDVSVSEADCFG